MVEELKIGDILVSNIYNPGYIYIGSRFQYEIELNKILYCNLDKIVPTIRNIDFSIIDYWVTFPYYKRYNKELILEELNPSISPIIDMKLNLEYCNKLDFNIGNEIQLYLNKLKLLGMSELKYYIKSELDEYKRIWIKKFYSMFGSLKQSEIGTIFIDNNGEELVYLGIDIDSSEVYFRVAKEKNSIVLRIMKINDAIKLKYKRKVKNKLYLQENSNYITIPELLYQLEMRSF